MYGTDLEHAYQVTSLSSVAQIINLGIAFLIYYLIRIKSSHLLCC